MSKYQTSVTDTKNLWIREVSQYMCWYCYPFQRKLQYGWNDGECRQTGGLLFSMQKSYE